MTIHESPLFNAPEAKAVTEPRLALVRQAGWQYAQTGKIDGALLAEIGTPMIPEETYAARKCQRRGYACEALRAVIETAFRGGAHRVYAQCDPRNEASWKLLEKLGLQREAHFRQNIFFHRDASERSIWKDTDAYAMLAPQ